MVLNPNGEVLEEQPFFNSEFVKEHHLKSMRGGYATKFDMDIIRPNTDAFVYEFDRIGQLVRKYKIHRNDTLISTYQYDYKGNITLHRESNKFGYYEHRFEFDDLDRIVKIELRRDKKSDHNKLSFELDESKVVSTEHFEYIPLEGIDYKRMCYNSANRVYKIEFYYFNTDGVLAKKESTLHNGSSRSEVNYFYNKKGQIEEIKTISKGSGTHVNSKRFEYDEVGNVMAKKTYRNGKIISENQLVFAKETGLLKAIITRGEAGNMLTILQFNNYKTF